MQDNPKEELDHKSDQSMDEQLLTMAGECAMELIIEEADAIIADIDWSELEQVTANLDAWFEKLME